MNSKIGLLIHEDRPNSSLNPVSLEDSKSALLTGDFNEETRQSARVAEA